MDVLALELLKKTVIGSGVRPRRLAGSPGGDAMNGDAMNRVSTSAAALGSIDWYEGTIRALQERISATADEGLARDLQGRVEMLQSAVGDLKIRIGID